jgi:tetratricopeptide (TPR) repeat protein
MHQEYLKFQKGDVITQQAPTGEWSVLKIVELDRYPDISATAQCLIYREVATKPTLGDLSTLEIAIGHAPILASSFNDGYELIASTSVTADDIAGFTYYLKLTDFERYLAFTGQDLNEITTRAIACFQQAIALEDKGKQDEAIELYNTAIDLFPYFFEAVDNRSFIYMDRGDYNMALSGFEESLRVEPDGFTAFLSKGECLMQLGRLDEAESIFNLGLTKFPEQQESIDKLLKRLKSRSRTSDD